MSGQHPLAHVSNGQDVFESGSKQLIFDRLTAIVAIFFDFINYNQRQLFFVDRKNRSFGVSIDSQHPISFTSR